MRLKCSPSGSTTRATRAGRAAIAIGAALFAWCAGLAHASSDAQSDTQFDMPGPASSSPQSMAERISAGAQEAALNAVQAVMARDGQGTSRRVEVHVGQLDPRLTLSACGRVEPFLPTGARLWGRTSIGVRCVEGSSWSVLLPVTVKVWGKALIANTPLHVGVTPSAGDFRVEEVDLTRIGATLVASIEELHGRVLARPVAGGQPLRQDALRYPPSVSAGDPVRILLVGQGFTISAEGVAVTTAAEGERVRVRTESGKVLVGPVRDRAVVLNL